MLVNPLNKKKGLMGEMLDGGMAEYCLVAADQLVAMPDGVTFAEAASLPVAYGTAHRMLITHNTVKKGDSVLVLGASGGVGTGCVILAKLLAPRSSPAHRASEKLDRLKELGADEVVDYSEVDWSKWAIEKYGKPQRRSYEGGVDVVDQFHRRRHLGAVAALPQARRQAPGLRRHRRPRSEGGPALCLELRDQYPWLQQLLRRRSRRA